MNHGTQVASFKQVCVHYPRR